MASYVDRDPANGAMLVLPPDDFYQMPYRWGYYGIDTFVGDLMHRPVLVPSGQTYFGSSPYLVGVVNLAVQSMLAGDWPLVDRILRVLGTPFLLTFGEISIRAFREGPSCRHLRSQPPWGVHQI